MKKVTTQTLFFTAITTIASMSVKGELLSIPNTGFYVGGALGGAELSTESNLFISRIIAGAITPQNFSLKTTDKNIAGDIFVGYGKRINCFSLEGEFLGSFASLKSISKLGITTANPQLGSKTTNALGGAVKLGYYINATSKLYFKMGFELRRFEIIFTDLSNSLLSLNKSYNSTAFVPGIGIESDLTTRISLRTEYRVALHPKKISEVTSVALSKVTSSQIKPTIHYLNVGLVFKI